MRKSVSAIALVLAVSTVSACAAKHTVDVRAVAGNEQQTKLDQAQADSALRLARASRGAGDYGSAISLYRSVLSMGRGDPMVAVELGDTLNDAGALDDAIDVYQRVDIKSPARSAALLGLEQTYLAIPDLAKALAYSDQALALSPGDSRVLIARGVVLDMLKRHKEAQDLYRAVLATAPRNVPARNNLALSLSLTGTYDEAVEILAPMAKSSTATPKIRQNLALIYGLKGDVQSAAALSRMDLDQATTDANLRFFNFIGK